MLPWYRFHRRLAAGIEPSAKHHHSPRRKQRGSLSVFRALYNFNIQPAMARPISSGESSWT